MIHAQISTKTPPVEFLLLPNKIHPKILGTTFDTICESFSRLMKDMEILWKCMECNIKIQINISSNLDYL